MALRPVTRSKRCFRSTGSSQRTRRPDQHLYELFPHLEEIEHRTTRVKRWQSNGIIERPHSTLLNEYISVQGRKT